VSQRIEAIQPEAPMKRNSLILHSSRQLNIAAPMFRVLERLGMTIKRSEYDLDEIRLPDHVHLIWGMSHSVETYMDLALLDNVFFMENGWFTQSTGCYMDKKGPNGISSIRGSLSLNGRLSDAVAGEVLAFVENLHRKLNVRPAKEQTPYLFVPLQVEKDTQLLFWSGCDAYYPNRQVWFIDRVCEAFPDMKIIIRPHPLDAETPDMIRRHSIGFRRHKDIHFRAERSSYDWIAGSVGVVGINSTVLMEALTLAKPVCAMGWGIFSGNGVMYECEGDPSRLRAFLNYRPNRSRVTRFLHLLMSRQIPYRLNDADVNRYPVLVALLASAGIAV
jgi:hypothetical protein